MTIKAITFDFWATLYKPRQVDPDQRLLKFKNTLELRSGQVIDLPQIKQAINLAREAWSLTWTNAHRTLGADEWLTIMLKELNLSLTAEHLLEIQNGMENSVLEQRPTLVPEAGEFLSQLATHYRLAIISDTGITPGRVLRQILETDQVIEHFNHLTFSDELGRSKPHPDAFRSTLAALGVSPAEAVHVGDLLRTDIAGAQGMGMRGVQYVGVSHDEGSDMSDASITPDAIIKDHRELIPLLRQWDLVEAS